MNVRVPRHGPRGILPGLVVWFGAANGAAQEEGRERRQAAGAAGAAVAGCAAGVWRNLQEPRDGVHAVERSG